MGGGLPPEGEGHLAHERGAAGVHTGWTGAGGVGDVVRPDEQEAVEALSLQLFLELGMTLPAHPNEIRCVGDDGGADRPSRVDGASEPHAPVSTSRLRGPHSKKVGTFSYT